MRKRSNMLNRTHLRVKNPFNINDFFNFLQMLYMDSKVAKQYILDVLVDKFNCDFTSVEESPRHYVFDSEDYVFKISIALCYIESEQALKSKVRRWIDRDFVMIKPKSTIIYDEHGEIQPSSVISGK